MKRDWRDVLKGVTLAEFQRHPELYEKEPYRTAWREAMEEFDRGTRDARERLHAIIGPFEPEIRAAFDLFAELEPYEAAAHIKAMHSAQMRAKAKGPRVRPSPYATEFRMWMFSAAKHLAFHPLTDDADLAQEIKRATNTKAALRRIREWIPHNRLDIEDAVTKLKERAATRRDVGNGTRNLRRDISR